MAGQSEGCNRHPGPIATPYDEGTTTMNAHTSIAARLPLATALTNLASAKIDAAAAMAMFNDAEAGKRDMTPAIEEAWSEAATAIMTGVYDLCSSTTDSLPALVIKLAHIRANAIEVNRDEAFDRLLPSLIADLSAMTISPVCSDAAWSQLVANYEAANAAEDGAAFAKALDTLLLTPAPSLAALGYKLAVFDANQIVDLWHTAEQISAQLAEDARRLIAQPVKPTVPDAWTAAAQAFIAADEAQAAYDRDHLSPCIAAYHADEQNAERQDDLSAKEAIFDKLIDTRASAIETLMPQPAPDAAGLALKLDIFHRCELALWEHGDTWLATIAADAKRIAGEA